MDKKQHLSSKYVVYSKVIEKVTGNILTRLKS